MVAPNGGVHVDDFKEKTGFEIYKLYGEEVENLIQLGLLEMDGTQLRIPKEQQFISDAIFPNSCSAKIKSTGLQCKEISLAFTLSNRKMIQVVEVRVEVWDASAQ